MQDEQRDHKAYVRDGRCCDQCDDSCTPEVCACLQGKWAGECDCGEWHRIGRCWTCGGDWPLHQGMSCLGCWARSFE